MNDDTTETSRHISVWVEAEPIAVYAFASDPDRLPLWAAGLGDPTLADADVEFVPANALGVLDHVVTLPSGEQAFNPMRVVPAGIDEPRCEVVFTVRRRPGMTDEQFKEDCAAVTADLERLRGLVEGSG